MSVVVVEVGQLVLRMVLALVFIGMGIMHFRPKPRRLMAKIIPPRMRWRGIAKPENLVAFTGVCELTGGVGLMIPVVAVPAGICLAVFLVAVFPANAYASEHPDRFGRLAIPLVPRLIGQLALIAACIVAVA